MNRCLVPPAYVCTGCQMQFDFKYRSADYYLGEGPLGVRVDQSSLLAVPVRPAWCLRCEALCLAEDIVSLCDMENAYGAVRAGRLVEYPLPTEFMDKADAEREVEKYLRWRMERRHPARALCCGGGRFQFMDVAQPLFKHADCDFGVIEPVPEYIGPYNGPGSGVYSPANEPVYSTEGDLIGLLTWRKVGESAWRVEPVRYPNATEE